jgi:NADH dehydrogenase
MSKASQDTLKALTKLGVVVQIRKLITWTTPYSYQLEKRFKPKINGLPVFQLVFEGIPAESRGRRMATDAFNKVNGTENIYAIGDTCIQLTDGGFPNGHPQVQVDSARLNLAKNFLSKKKRPNPI